MSSLVEPNPSIPLNSGYFVIVIYSCNELTPKDMSDAYFSVCFVIVDAILSLILAESAGATIFPFDRVLTGVAIYSILLEKKK